MPAVALFVTCVVDQITPEVGVGAVRSAIELQSTEAHPSNMSRVSGPSRTADLEMRQTIGVHGPRSVDVVVIA